MTLRHAVIAALALAFPISAAAQRGLVGLGEIATENPQRASEHGSTGNYRITVAGFRVNRDTYDDPLNRDGWGDEVYASVVLQRFNRSNGRVLEARTVTSQTHGDATADRTRVAQGHASDAGGLTGGDVVPFGWDERSVKPPIEKGRFPLVVWEGVLTDGGDVLVLRPALWEHDGSRTAFDAWTRSVASSSPRATWGLAGVQQSLATAAITPVVGPPRDLTIVSGRDRPIGLRDHQWYDRLVVLDRRKIEAALREPGRAPGLIELRLQEQGGKRGRAEKGDYVLYLRVERQTYALP